MNKIKTHTKGDKAFFRWCSFLLIVLFGYLGLRDVKPYKNDLNEIKIRLRKNPEIIKRNIKGRTYKTIILTSYEYKNIFKVNDDWYETANINEIKSEIFDGDSISVLVKKEDSNSLNENHLLFSENIIYNIKNWERIS